MSREAPNYRGRQPSQADIARFRTADFGDMLKLFVAEEAVRNPPPPGPPAGAGGIDEQLLREMVRQILAADPADPYLRFSIKQVLAEESNKVETHAAEIAFKEKKTVVPPEAALTTNDRNEVDYYARNPGTGAFVLTVVMAMSGIFSDEDNKDKDSKGDAATDDQGKAEGGDDDDNSQTGQSDENQPDSGKGGGGEDEDAMQKLMAVVKGRATGAAQQIVHKIMAILSPFLLLGGQYTFVYCIFSDAYGEYTGGICPGDPEILQSYNILYQQNATKLEYYLNFGANLNVRVMMAFIAALFVVKNVQTLFAFMSSLKSTGVPPPLAKSKPKAKSSKDNSENERCELSPSDGSPTVLADEMFLVWQGRWQRG